MPYEGLEARMDLRGNVLRSPSRRTKSQSTGEGSGRTVGSRRDGDTYHDGLQGELRRSDRVGRAEQERRRDGINIEGDMEDTASSPGKQDKNARQGGEGSGRREGVP